jgi:serine/threonine protein kinase
MERRDALEDYEQIKKVGSGSFGAAHLVRSKKSRQLYVMKVVKLGQMKPKDRDAMRLEVSRPHFWQPLHLYPPPPPPHTRVCIGSQAAGEAPVQLGPPVHREL